MNRRGFIQISSVAILPILLGVFPKSTERKKYTIKVQSNRAFGHLLRTTSAVLPTSETITDYIIVGGGVAGISAAHALKNEKFILFEGSQRLGGSSASESWKDTRFSMGAHYELAYPNYFGTEVIDLLQQLNVIKYNSSSELFEFVDKEYVIEPNELEQCFHQNEVFKDVLSDAKGADDFYKCLEPFEGTMTLPTRLINEDYHYLNDITFKDYLESKMELSEDLELRISYQMIDDWGGKCDEISALAGIHYYTCRPYNTKEIELFSAPFGNSYFIEKMLGDIPNLDSLKTDSMVRKINVFDHGVEAEILNKNGDVELVKAKGLIYAGQKHALKYILESEVNLFDTNYAPWVVLNIVCRKGVKFEKWQNDVLTNELNFLGFVNSSKQTTRSKDYDTFTAYYCFSSEEKELLVDIEKNPDNFVESTLSLIEEKTGTFVTEFVDHVNVNLMAHAMPISKPDYLTFSDVPQYKERVVFAGVDTGRLPLFFEACDSGLQAGQRIVNNCKKI